MIEFEPDFMIREPTTIPPGLRDYKSLGLYELESYSAISLSIYCGLPLVEKSILGLVMRNKYIQICMVLKKAQHSRNKKNSKFEPRAV